MPNYGTYAICPYFSNEDAVTIKCEGVTPLGDADTHYHVRFHDGKEKKKFLHQYCESRDYLKCPYAALLESAYDDSGKCSKPKVQKVFVKENKSKKSKSKQITGQYSFTFIKEGP